MKTDNGPLATNYDVAIIGSGPAGLSTAIELKKLGVSNIVVLERADEAGGNPRHCGHSPFGLREFKRVYFGPAYAKKMVSEAQKLDIHIALNSSVTSIGEGGLLTLSTVHGAIQIQAKKVVLSTGIREMPRSARFVSGQRPAGIMTAGALQSLVYLSGKKPFKNPVIVGSELVSFSSIASCRHAGIKPVAMFEEGKRTTAYKILSLFPRLLGIKYMLNTRLASIEGKDQVSAVTVINSKGEKEAIQCDGVVFTGKFTPEASLARMAHIEIDPKTQGPIIDQYGRCSDPDYFATGNTLRGVETGDWCWAEGKQIALFVKQSLAGKLPDIRTQLRIEINSEKIQYVIPQRISYSEERSSIKGMSQFQLRVNKVVNNGSVTLTVAGTEIASKSISSQPERRLLMPVPDFSQHHKSGVIKVDYV